MCRSVSRDMCLSPMGAGLTMKGELQEVRLER